MLRKADLMVMRSSMLLPPRVRMSRSHLGRR